MSPYIPRLMVAADGRVVISVKLGEGPVHGSGFRWLLIDGPSWRWVEPGEFGPPEFVEVAVMHPTSIKISDPRTW